MHRQSTTARIRNTAIATSKHSKSMDCKHKNSELNQFEINNKREQMHAATSLGALLDHAYNLKRVTLFISISATTKALFSTVCACTSLSLFEGVSGF